MKLAFALALSQEALHLQPLLIELERCMASKFDGLSYGPRVKEVVILLSAIDERLRIAGGRKPVFYAGQTEISEEGISFEIEDLLEFEVCLKIRSNNHLSLAEVGEAAASGVQDVSQQVLALNLSGFDAAGFLGDLSDFFRTGCVVSREQGAG